MERDGERGGGGRGREREVLEMGTYSPVKGPAVHTTHCPVCPTSPVHLHHINSMHAMHLPTHPDA